MSVIRISTQWAQCPMQTPIKATPRMNWNDNIAEFISTTRLATTRPKEPKVSDVVVAGPCTEVPWWWGHGRGE